MPEPRLLPAASLPSPEPFRLDVDLGRGPLGRAVRPLLPAAERVLGLARLQALYERRPRDCGPERFFAWALEALGVQVDLAEPDLAKLPRSGPAVVVANHPYGAIEGLVLGRLLAGVRDDARIMANYFLGRIPELRDRFLLVDPFDSRDSVGRNLAPMRRSLRWLAGGGLLVVFPAGEVAHLRWPRRRIEDPPWSPLVAGLVRRARCPVVPVHFGGRNSPAFQLLGLVHPRLRTAMLAREMLRLRGETVEVRIGSPIPFRQLEACGGDGPMIDYLRSRVLVLGERLSRIGGGPMQPRLTPRKVAPVVAAAPVSELTREVERLPPSQLLVDGPDQIVYVAEADQIPAVLREIGRLRELSFREVGEGTGREIDLDEFDATYRHLFIWSRAEHQVVGAYRLGLTDELTRARGLAGLYTTTLFDFRARLLEEMGPGLEMGRSFIRPEHQKSYTGLLLLWKGIGRFVVENPRYATLFGPVSISADYQSASQQLIVAFLEQNNYAHEWARWVRPRGPRRLERSAASRLGPARLRTLEDVSEFIAEIEADQKGVPILLKQYLRLGGRLLGFNVDPEFSNVLDVLIMVDLRRTPRKTLDRYMTPSGAAAFLAHHQVTGDVFRRRVSGTP